MNTVAKIIRTRRGMPEFGWGDYRVLDIDSREVLAHTCEWRGNTVVAVHNLCDEPREIALQLDGVTFPRKLITVLEDREYPILEDGEYRFYLGGYGYRWLRLEGTRR